MIKAPHTPGPWIAGPTGDTMKSYSQPFAVAEYNRPNLVAGVFGDVKGGEEVARANANLIAAAPELLEALEQCIVRLEPSNSTWDKKAFLAAKQAIVKAKGETL